MTTSAALVLSVVDGHTRVSHLVATETARLHRHSGRYPALCGDNVISASLATEPVQDCKKCQRRSGKSRKGEWCPLGLRSLRFPRAYCRRFCHR